MYIHEQKDWPNFTWDMQALASQLAAVRHRQGLLFGHMKALGFPLRAEASLQTLTQDVLKSSEIEGEILNQDHVRSSVARRLGIDIAATFPPDRDVEGIVEMMLDATQKFDSPLTQSRLFNWHASLFPTGRSGFSKITVAAWRTTTMRVISGPVGKEKIHYEAPPANRLPQEMKLFLKWFEQKNVEDLVLKAGIAHLWFVAIHPFADGNGRTARAIADLMLARSENSTERFYSMSAQIQHERNDYYKILESTHKGSMDITSWLTWFLACLNRAFDRAESTLSQIFKAAAFWENPATHSLNDRQRKVLHRLLNNFQGKLTSTKYAKLAKCSPDTALRDIEDLLARHLLTKSPSGGRSTNYSLLL